MNKASRTPVQQDRVSPVMDVVNVPLEIAIVADMPALSWSLIPALCNLSLCGAMWHCFWPSSHRGIAVDIGIAVDNTVPLHIPAFARFVAAHAKAIRCHALRSNLRFNDAEIDYINAIASLERALRKEAGGFDVTLLITAIPFANNYFYEGSGGLYVVSVSDWHLLTTLPISNGIAYMLCQIITKHHMGIGTNHDDRTGCINDFWWDKTGIDVGMRAAFICDQCKKKSANNPNLSSQEFSDVIAILNAISSASRRGADVLLEPVGMASGPMTNSTPLTFLCHNNQDKSLIRHLNETLKNGGIRTWFDEEQIQPGEIWQDKLEASISSIGSCLIIVGDSGLGPWQDMERRAFINEFANRGCRIIPVLLGNPNRPPELPLFLRQFMWADLRNNDAREVAKLIAALRN